MHFKYQTVLFQTIQSSLSTQSECQTALFDQSGATTLHQSGSGSDGNKGVHCIPQSSSIIEA